MTLSATVWTEQELFAKNGEVLRLRGRWFRVVASEAVI